MKQLFSYNRAGIGWLGIGNGPDPVAGHAGWRLLGAHDSGPGGTSGERLRVETTGNVTLRGAATEQTTYILTVRVRAGDAREAEALMRSN